MASHDRAVALGEQLAQAHRELRRQIEQLTASLDHGRPADPVLVTHCLAFCSALTSHHRGEDAGMFAQLLAERPDLAGVVSNLVEDHAMIAAILTRIAELAERAADSPGAASEAVRRELAGLSAIVESHFRYEERTISAALDAGVPDTGWSEPVFRFRDGAR